MKALRRKMSIGTRCKQKKHRGWIIATWRMKMPDRSNPRDGSMTCNCRNKADWCECESSRQKFVMTLKVLRCC